ncbi:hypothetical protein [Cysteiniphilum sp. JM-1]|uniref:hypothetical protein n=1 Tax=Cysteiniphilum sp. JM-1 TaxID=2610891 RepID=UPI001244638F|nr:hypothetical protein [Cysteiniphilum sp. JM-1]
MQKTNKKNTQQALPQQPKESVINHVINLKYDNQDFVITCVQNGEKFKLKEVKDINIKSIKLLKFEGDNVNIISDVKTQLTTYAESSEAITKYKKPNKKNKNSDNTFTITNIAQYFLKDIKEELKGYLTINDYYKELTDLYGDNLILSDGGNKVKYAYENFINAEFNKDDRTKFINEINDMYAKNFMQKKVGKHFHRKASMDDLDSIYFLNQHDMMKSVQEDNHTLHSHECEILHDIENRIENDFKNATIATTMDSLKEAIEHCSDSFSITVSGHAGTAGMKIDVVNGNLKYQNSTEIKNWIEQVVKYAEEQNKRIEKVTFDGCFGGGEPKNKHEDHEHIKGKVILQAGSQGNKSINSTTSIYSVTHPDSFTVGPSKLKNPQQLIGYVNDSVKYLLSKGIAVQYNTMTASPSLKKDGKDYHSGDTADMTVKPEWYSNQSEMQENKEQLPAPQGSGVVVLKPYHNKYTLTDKGIKNAQKKSKLLLRLQIVKESEQNLDKYQQSLDI